MEKYYTVDEVAAITGLTSRTIRTYIADGKLTGVRLGKQWRFTEDDIAALYTSPEGSASLRRKLFKGEIKRAAERFLSEQHDSLRICVIVDCAGMTEGETAELAEKLKERCPPSGMGEIVQDGDKLLFSGSASRTAKLLKLIKNL